MSEREPSSAYAPERIKEINRVAGLLDDRIPIRRLIFWNKTRTWEDPTDEVALPPEWGQLKPKIPFSTRGNLGRALTLVLESNYNSDVGTLRDPDSLTMLTQATREFILACFVIEEIKR